VKVKKLWEELQWHKQLPSPVGSNNMDHFKQIW